MSDSIVCCYIGPPLRLPLHKRRKGHCQEGNCRQIEKATAPPSHPPTQQMVDASIKNLKERGEPKPKVSSVEKSKKKLHQQLEQLKRSRAASPRRPLQPGDKKSKVKKSVATKKTAEKKTKEKAKAKDAKKSGTVKAKSTTSKPKSSAVKPKTPKAKTTTTSAKPKKTASAPKKPKAAASAKKAKTAVVKK
ncbi:histone H1-like [Scaptodrosophila lebanonensis]|uniref:Histone H1-like n=1 Tax=Drosophila lebanonensis TaxID=7225 RepID=A0A6J2U262_DROLE|nr:histone H1-like [Scaptodrosophila lebanonensis]